ncbi:MAG TPA: tetraacyldisaccharide 4'-kinase [Burkholderiales bacterium]|jgi:tetraacyldisaccharide 4'-kinase|nr:tetraacyldisaccharide 4'-kinase [Burkholderiales bacterium]
MTSSEFSQRHWYRLSLLSCLLAPLSLLFLLVVTLRRMAYRGGLLPRTRFHVPVLVVGNLVAGGTGKTPLVLWLVEGLKRAGWKPGIISRGYKGHNKTPRLVRADDLAAEVGDEPLLLAQRSGVPVCIGRKRVEAGRGLLEAHSECDVLISDDGLQHYALARDFEIAVEDARGFGNGLLLPAGPLREPPGRAVDAVVMNGEARREGVWSMRLEARDFYGLDNPQCPVTLQSLRGLRLHAVAGIGDPQRFFDTLSGLGLQFTPHAFPDHHAYTPQDLQFEDCDAVLMTEKDAVKCGGFGRHDLYALPIEARVENALIELIDTRLSERRHGS